MDGCDQPAKTRGWCAPHYHRWKRHGDPEGGRNPDAPPLICKINDCAEPVRSSGWCKRHYQRWYLTGDPLTPDKHTRRGASLRERIEAKTIRTDYCWFWTGRPNSDGYGMITVTTPEGRKTLLAHRASYEVFVGPIPGGLELDHLCRNRACCRPDHLEPVTHEVNVRRGASMERKTECKHGHEYTPENTYWKQCCITCERAARAKWKGRRKAA